MPKIRCHYIDCAFLDEGYCSAAQVELDPDSGCATYVPNENTPADAGWDEDSLDEWEEVEEEVEDEEEDWLDEDEEEDEY